MTDDERALYETLLRFLEGQANRVLVNPNWRQEDESLFYLLNPILLAIAAAEAEKVMKRAPAG